MKVEIIAAGSELLTPYFIDTNSLYLTERLEELGLSLSFRTTVGDDGQDLFEAAGTALRRSDLILVSGGLGPTEDDRTREAFSQALGRRLIFKRHLKEKIKERFARRGLAMPPTNLKQCRVIEGAVILENKNGTAPGLWIESGEKLLALLPGPPWELKPIFENQVVPRLIDILGRRHILRRKLKLTGLGESDMEERIKPVYDSLPAGVSITTLARPGDLSILISLSSEDNKASILLDGIEGDLMTRIGGWVYSNRGEDLEAVVAAMLRDSGSTVACAESCSGGLLSDRLTSIPGSSAYFLESIVAYSNAAKVKALGISSRLIKSSGAVSRKTAAAMAQAIRNKSGADFGLAVTGIAGPAGGTASKPVGLVFTAVSDGSGTVVEKNLFAGNRAVIKFLASQRTLDMLRRRLAEARPKPLNFDKKRAK